MKTVLLLIIFFMVVVMANQDKIKVNDRFGGKDMYCISIN
jgi:uncharacterized integral membrane protein